MRHSIILILVAGLGVGCVKNAEQTTIQQTDLRWSQQFSPQQKIELREKIHAAQRLKERLGLASDKFRAGKLGIEVLDASEKQIHAYNRCDRRLPPLIKLSARFNLVQVFNELALCLNWHFKIRPNITLGLAYLDISQVNHEIGLASISGVRNEIERVKAVISPWAEGNKQPLHFMLGKKNQVLHAMDHKIWLPFGVPIEVLQSFLAVLSQSLVSVNFGLQDYEWQLAPSEVQLRVSHYYQQVNQALLSIKSALASTPPPPNNLSFTITEEAQSPRVKYMKSPQGGRHIFFPFNLSDKTLRRLFAARLSNLGHAIQFRNLEKSGDSPLLSSKFMQLVATIGQTETMIKQSSVKRFSGPLVYVVGNEDVVPFYFEQGHQRTRHLMLDIPETISGDQLNLLVKLKMLGVSFQLEEPSVRKTLKLPGGVKLKAAQWAPFWSALQVLFSAIKPFPKSVIEDLERFVLFKVQFNGQWPMLTKGGKKYPYFYQKGNEISFPPNISAATLRDFILIHQAGYRIMVPDKDYPPASFQKALTLTLALLQRIDQVPEIRDQFNKRVFLIKPSNGHGKQMILANRVLFVDGNKTLDWYYQWLKENLTTQEK